MIRFNKVEINLIICLNFVILEVTNFGRFVYIEIFSNQILCFASLDINFRPIRWQKKFYSSSFPSQSCQWTNEHWVQSFSVERAFITFRFSVKSPNNVTWWKPFSSLPFPTSCFVRTCSNSIIKRNPPLTFDGIFYGKIDEFLHAIKKVSTLSREFKWWQWDELFQNRRSLRQVVVHSQTFVCALMCRHCRRH